jgi:hypothetical protein
MVGQPIARVNAPLAAARRCAALTRAIRRPNAGSYRRASHVSATAVGGLVSRVMGTGAFVDFHAPRTRRYQLDAARILRHDTTRGTQDVNDAAGVPSISGGV